MLKSLKFSFALFILSIITVFLFNMFDANELKKMDRVAVNIQLILSRHLHNVMGSVEYLHLSATNILNNKNKFTFDKPFFSKYENNRYCYSLYEPTSQEPLVKNKANLLGWSKIVDTKEYIKEQEAALFLSSYLKLVYETNKNFAWVYYFSKHNFTVVYPYISANDFSFTQNLDKEPFFQCATPKLNPKAKLFFTPLYTDVIGKGLMLTIGKPVYYKKEFLGTMDIDITLNHMDNALLKLDTLKNKSMIYNDRFEVLGSNNIIKDFNRSKIYKADDFLPKEILLAKETSKVIYLDGKYLFIKKIKDTPFTFLYYQDAKIVWWHSLLYVVPIVLFFFLFVLVLYLYKKAKSAMACLEDQAMKDYMTGAFNRRYFFEVSSAIFLKVKRNKTAVAIIMTDIDDFKKINDTYGHQAGDIGIKYVKEVFDNNLRKSDLFARFGGEEFCILLDDISLKDTKMLVEKIRKEFESTVLESDNCKFSYTVSFGVAYGLLDDVEDMINLADKALYKSKNNGKNRVTIYTTH
ncbi:sensor domain-containing diguanylate cyclase [Sulfurimonas sp.]